MDRSLNLKPAFILSILIAFLAAMASVGGLLMDNLYRDNDFVRAAWFANDLITALVAVPLLAVSLGYVKKGSRRGQLVWIGLLGYMAYNYAFYLFGAAFNSFFILYAVLFSLSGTALILGLSNLDVNLLARNFSPKLPVKGISMYVLVIGFMLFMVEISMITNYLLTGILPLTITQTGHPTAVVFALDLSVVVPLSLISAVLLWKRRAWGYVMGMMMLIKGFAYGLVLSIGTALLAYSPAYGKWDSLMPFYVVLVIGGFIGCLLMLKSLKEEGKSEK